MVGFPRPDWAARKQIWLQCLPEGSHVLDDFDFRQLARKIDLTGGHIRQISLCAAFIAAAAGTLINLEHIEHAAPAGIRQARDATRGARFDGDKGVRMNADAILRVTVALRDRLKVALTRSQVPGTVFVGPLDDPDASGAALVLFLYRIAPAASQRNSEHRVPSGKPQPSVVVYRNSFPLDLYFLLTVGTTPGSSEETLLKALGYAIQEIQNSPDLVGSDVGHETVHVTFEPLSTEDASRIWALFPTANYRTSIAYLATPVSIDPPDAELLPERVGHHELNAGAQA